MFQKNCSNSFLMWQDHFWGTNLYPPSPHMSFPFSLSCSQLGTAPTWASSPQGQLAVETTEVDNVAWHGGHRRRGGCALRQWPGEKRARETQKGPHFVVSENRGDLEIKPNKPQERLLQGGFLWPWGLPFSRRLLCSKHPREEMGAWRLWGGSSQM